MRAFESGAPDRNDSLLERRAAGKEREREKGEFQLRRHGLHKSYFLKRLMT